MTISVETLRILFTALGWASAVFLYALYRHRSIMHKRLKCAVLTLLNEKKPADLATFTALATLSDCDFNVVYNRQERTVFVGGSDYGDKYSVYYDADGKPIAMMDPSHVKFVDKQIKGGKVQASKH
ncbi:MAG: hypothetical protein ACD_76C00140G0002 [uncultured bacterium]|nr:MAG: hypothetical protein ACD_76C00140G0002 [uncultured bacterium]HBD04950.1 hypothetical protein [Candidatus Uhrbacteria bacterium]